MPVTRKKPTISNYQFLCALLYIIENDCKWMVWPKKYEKKYYSDLKKSINTMDSETHIIMMVLNDLNSSRTLLTITDGATAYHCLDEKNNEYND